MRIITKLLLLLAGLIGLCSPGFAAIGTIDDVPAATLLLPYFEVDIANADGMNTVFSINNASANSVLAHVTIWTDQSVPGLDFDVYLTGYDVQSISLRDIFVNGNLPVTASAGQDPKDTISPQGPASKDINVASCSTLPYAPGAVSTTFRAHLQAWFQGNQSPATGNCAGAKFQDNILRGYVTVDTVNACNLFFPSDWAFYAPFVTDQNVLWGDYFYLNPSQNFAQGETLVHIESCPTCFVPGDHTFYGRFNAATAADHREGLPTAMAARYGGALSAGTEFLIWREGNAADSPYNCSLQGPPAWYPLQSTGILIFDEQEQGLTAEECPSGDPTCEQEVVVPNHSQRVDVAADLLAPFDSGWAMLVLEHPAVIPEYGDQYAQMWMTTMTSMEGRYLSGFDAIQLNNASFVKATTTPTRECDSFLTSVWGIPIVNTSCIDTTPKPQISIVDGNFNPLSGLPIGESLFVGVSGLEPDRSYQVWLYDDSSFAVSYYQMTSNGSGNIEPSVLWYHSGVHGCSVRPAQAEAYSTHPYAFTRFDEAETVLANRTFRLAVRDPETDSELTSHLLPLILDPTRVRAYFSDASGCLMNSFSAGGVEPTQDVFMTIENLPASATSQTLQVFVVPNRYGWVQGDALADPRSPLLRNPITVPTDQTRITSLLWPADQLVSGAWDLVVRINSAVHDAVLLASDIISYPLDTGALLMLFYDSACPSGYEFDIAGRPIAGYPYFEFSDVFHKNESMWGAVDPAFVPAGHPGGTYGAYYVIADGSAGGGLVDVSGGHEIAPVKAGCINATVTNIWNSSQVGTYDVVVDFGAVPAATAGAWTADNTYNANYDFIDRSAGTGAWVVEDPALPGPYTVQSWSYAPDPANPNDPLWTDISDYFKFVSCGPCESSGGTAPDPLHGEVRYPIGAGPGPFPLVLVVHGNALQSLQSEQGYFYLLDLLASHGMIAVSVDENFLNGTLGGEMDARAIILLRHLQRWRTWNSTAGHLFYNKVDLSRIGLAGHSRGGEAVTVAWLFNTSLHNAGDPDHNFNFNIRSLFAIAPVDSMIVGDIPAPPVLRDVDYFIMHGSHDGDVWDFQGQKTYDRAHPVTLPTNGLKSLLWVYGANHDYWNTIWAAHFPDVGVQPTSQRITAAQQQDIGKVYMSAFFQQTLLGRIAYKALLTGDATFPTLPANVTRVHQYHDPKRIFINHYEEDDNLATNSSGTADANPGGLVTPYVDHAFEDKGNPYWHWQETDGLVAGWTNPTARYEMGLPNLVGMLICDYPYVAFRVGQNYEPVPDRNTVGQSQDFSVRLQLAQPSATLAVSRYDTLPYPMVTTWSPGGGDTTKTILKTVRIPLRTFLLNQPALDLRDITRLDFLFNRKPTGLLSIDDVQITD